MTGLFHLTVGTTSSSGGERERYSESEREEEEEREKYLENHLEVRLVSST